MIKEKALVALFKKFPSDVRVGRLDSENWLYSNVFFVVRAQPVPSFQFPDEWTSVVFSASGSAPAEAKEAGGVKFWQSFDGKEGKRVQVSNLLYELPGGSLSKPGTFYRQLERSGEDPTYLNKAICDLFAIDLDQLKEEYHFELLGNRCVRIVSNVYGVCAYCAPLDLKK